MNYSTPDDMRSLTAVLSAQSSSRLDIVKYPPGCVAQCAPPLHPYPFL